MRTMHESHYKLIGSFIFGIVFSTASTNAAAPTGQQVLEDLRSRDAALFEGFTLSMSMKTPRSHRFLEFERAQEEATITANNTIRGLVKHGTYKERPRFQPEGRRRALVPGDRRR